jgi:beta-glucanase (GH16 family)
MQKIVHALVFLIVIIVVGCDVPTPPPVVGCMDTAASNFNSSAQEDDGSCWYANSEGLIWSDEFDGEEIDPTKWAHETGNGDWGWGNGELQYYQAQNTVVSNGTAKIIVREESIGPFNYTSSRMKTDRLFSARYGRIQARIKTCEGRGFWPAFWLLPSGGQWPCDGEIDIMEQGHVTGTSTNTTGAAHLGACPYEQWLHEFKSFSTFLGNGEFYSDDFHIYEINWKEDKIEWFVDQNKVFEVTPNMYSSQYDWPFNSKDWYIILNLAITQNGPSALTAFPNQIEIDWVRWYQN